MLKCTSAMILLLASAVSVVDRPDDRETASPATKAAIIDRGPPIPPGHIRFAIRINQWGMAGAWLQPYDQVAVVHMVRTANGEVAQQIIVRKILLLGWLRDPEMVDVAVTPNQGLLLVSAMSVGELRLIIFKYGHDEL
jgi:hypothetical protein